MIPFETARFIASGLTESEFPHLKTDRGTLMPEIALIGRSNVGKSSLINTLLRDKKLAKTSATPGKTQRINFFVVDEKLLLVDLPGYGYSKAAKKDVSAWSEAIETFLTCRKTLSLLLILIDTRRNIGEEDLQMIEWVRERKIPFALIFTKSDKLSPSENEQALKKGKEALPPETDLLSFSTRDPAARRRLIQLVNRKL